MSDDDGLARGELLISLGRHGEALAALAPLLRQEPDNGYALCLTAQAHLQLDQPEEARRAAEAAIRADPTAEWPLRLLSIALREVGDPVRAVETAAQSVRMEPNLWEPRAILAIALSEVKGSRQRAKRVAETAVTIAPQEPQTHFVVGLVADRLGRHGDAENAYRRALYLNPQHAAARNNLSVILSRRGDYIGAAKGFTEAAVVDPRLAIARRNVDYVVIRMIQRAQVVALLTTFAVLAGPRLLQADSRVISFVAALTGLGIVVSSVVRFRSATPRRLHRYLQTLPARDRLATAWLVLLLLTFVLLGTGSLLPGQARWATFLLACGTVSAAALLSYVHTVRGTGRPSPG